MRTSSAPGKVYLFGEHAVVYGEPAVPCAIRRRARVTVDEREDGRLRVHARDLTLDGFTVEYAADSSGSGSGSGSGSRSRSGSGSGSGPETESETGPERGEPSPSVDVPGGLVEAAMGYVEGAVDQARAATDRPDAGFELTVESDIPLGAGLGSSAAVVVATIDAATRELGVDLAPAEVADRAYRVERDVQDGQASRADTFCSATGGAVRVEGEDCRSIEDVPALPFVIGYDGSAGETAELVAAVRSLREEYGFAADAVAAIGDVVREGERALAAGDLPTLGRLMDFDHGLLSALGVSARSLDAMVWAARDAGALGAKLTGAGGGGCVVALDETDETLTALEHTPECERAFRAPLDAEGVRRE